MAKRNYSNLNPAIAVAALLLGHVAAIGQTYVVPKPDGTGSLDNDNAYSGRNFRIPKHAPETISVVPEDLMKLKLQPGFLVSMEVYDAPEFASDLRIDINGSITVPMVGPVHVADKTLMEAADLIAASLQSAKILNSPQVNLNLSEYSGTNVSVLGEVHDPGRVELLAPHSLADVLAIAGGPTAYAGDVIEIRHPGGGSSDTELVHYAKATRDLTLGTTFVRPGDIVTVKRAGIIYVLGGVNRPGGYVMQEDGQLNLLQAISLASGTSFQAAIGNMCVVRKLVNGQTQQISIHYRDIVKGKMLPPDLQPEDIVYVPLSKAKVILSASLLSSAAASAAIHFY